MLSGVTNRGGFSGNLTSGIQWKICYLNVPCMLLGKGWVSGKHHFIIPYPYLPCSLKNRPKSYLQTFFQKSMDCYPKKYIFALSCPPSIRVFFFFFFSRVLSPIFGVFFLFLFS